MNFLITVSYVVAGFWFAAPISLVPTAAALPHTPAPDLRVLCD
jgi:hypothetical protein